MDLIYHSSSPSLSSNRSLWKLYSLSLTLVALATTMSVASILLSIQFWERSRSLIDEENRFEGQGPWMTGSLAVCMPCSAVLDSSSSTEERLLSEVFFAGHGFGSRAANDGGLSSGGKERCCAKSKRQLRTLLKMVIIIFFRLIYNQCLQVKYERMITGYYRSRV